MSHEDEDQVLSSDEDEARTPRTAQAHHAGLQAQLKGYAHELINDVAAGADVEPGRQRMLGFLHDDLLAHLEAERRVLYGAAGQAGMEVLVASLEVDHQLLLDLIADLDRAAAGWETALTVHALMVLIELRIRKEESVLLPALAEAGIEVSVLLDSMIVQMATEYGSRFGYV